MHSFNHEEAGSIGGHGNSTFSQSPGGDLRRSRTHEKPANGEIELTGTHATCMTGSRSPRPWGATLLRLGVASMLGACGSGGGDTSSSGAIATLAWDAPPSPDVAGYRIYYGTAPRTYFQPFGQGVDIANVTTHTVTGLAGATTYHFAVTAYDTLAYESAYSDEASKAIP